MNASQLKAELQKFAKKHGRNNLTQVEIDFMTGSIDFTGYLNRCYDEYVKTSVSRQRQSDRGYRK